MKRPFNFISVFAVLLCIIISLSACGGPAGKIVKNVHASYYYEPASDDADGNDTDTSDNEASKNSSNSVSKVANNPNKALSDETKANLLAEIEKLKSLYPEEMQLLSENNKSFAYNVVFPEKASNELSAAVKTFRSNAQRGLKAEINVAFDTDAKEAKNELLIGKTNRKLSASLLNRIKKHRKNCADDFFLYAKDGKIALVADTDETIIKALEWFTETFCESSRTWTYLRNGYEFLYAPKYSIPSISIAGKTIYDYSVVTPKCAEYVYGRAIDDVIDTMRNDLHYSMFREEERFSSADKEILIGDLSRKESKSVVPKNNEYIIQTVGNKLVIKGYDSVCLYYGVEKFHSLLKNALKSKKSLLFGESYSYTGKVNTKDSKTYQLVFNDEFDDSELLPVWKKYDGGTSGDYSVLGGSILNAGRSLCYLQDGILHMPTKRSAADSNNFDESKITLKNDLWYKYGCIEVCAKMPISPAHTAIWLNGLGEVDIVETFSSENSFRSNIHKWFTQNTWDGASSYNHTSLDGSAKYEDARKFSIDTKKYGGNLTSDFHVYSLDWTENYYRFAVDGKTYFRYDFSENEDEVDFFRQELYLILVCGIGSSSYGARYVPASHDGKVYDFQIDYVRLYQNPSTDKLSYK